MPRAGTAGGGRTADEAQKGTTSEEVNRLIVKHVRPGVKFTLEDVRGHRAVAVGLAERVGVVVDGDAGDFLAAFNAGAMVVGKGSVGNYVAYAQTAGVVQVVGGAGEAAGAFLHGGQLHIFGGAGAGVGFRMAGGELVVKDDVGALAGTGMAGGTLALLGRAAGTLGSAMRGGTVFARAGQAVDGSCCAAAPLDAEGARRLRALAASVKVADINPADFVVVAPLAADRSGAPPSPPGPRVNVEGGAPQGPAARVRVSHAEGEPKGGAVQ